MTLALVATVAAGPQTKNPGSGPSLSLSWLWNLLAAGPSWAHDPVTPSQQRGVSPAGGHYVSQPFVRDNAKVPKAKGELADFTPHRVAAGSRVAGSGGRGFDQATSRRVASAATDRSDVYANADGSFTRRVFEHPVNYRAADGSWQPVDSTLRRGSDGRWGVASNSVGVSFAGGPRGNAGGASTTDSAGVTGTGVGAAEDLVRVSPVPGVVVAYSLSGAVVGVPAVDREVARYARVLPGVDLELGAKATGAKETLVLRSADVPSEFVFPLRLTGVLARVAADGAVEFVDGRGAVVAWMPAGFMEDSAVDASGSGALSYGVGYQVVSTDAGPAVKMTVDRSWLRDPARKFPVRLDPTIATTTNDTYVQSTPVQVRTAENNVAVGTFDGGTGKAKALLPFPTFGTTYAGKNISTAGLNVFMSYQGVGTGCVARQFDVSRVTANWAASTVTYAAFPSFSASIGNASPSNAAACGNTAATRNVGTWVRVTLAPSAVNEWVTGGANYGLALTASETDSMAWKRFTSADPNLICAHGTYGSIQCDPFIDLTYTDNTAPQIDTRYPANNYTVATLTPELAAAGHDPDGWPNKGLRYNFLVYNATGTQIGTSGWVTSGVWRVPVGLLSWGQTYLYALQIDDYSSTGPAAPDAYAFTTQVPQPVVTGGLAQNGGKGYEANVGNYTTSDTDAQVATAGPALTLTRDYNSLDTRLDSGFGRGWSSIVDMRAQDLPDAAGVVQTVAVRYPNGQEVAFGRNNDGTLVSPSGRFSVFKTIAGGYSLTDKDATAYEFTQSGGAGLYRITRMSDASGRAVTFHYDGSGRVDQMRSLASGRTLYLTWSVPPNSANAHVASVSTDAATPGDPATVMTWTYSYDNDKLGGVCSPGSAGNCTAYEYTWSTRHPTTVLSTGPYSFWRLNEASGATLAASSVLSNDGADAGTYVNVGLGAAAALTDSTATSATFNGTSSMVTLPTKLVSEGAYQSISMWFRTTTASGVLFGYQRDPVTPGGTTPGGYNPVLYVGTDGKLRAELWAGNPTTAIVSSTVTDGQWHHVALSGSGGNQVLYLDGVVQGSMAGAITLATEGLTYAYLGAGYVGGSWPAQPNSTGTASFFNGSMADVAYYNQSLSAATVTALYQSGKFSTASLSKVTSAAGRVRAMVDYDQGTGRVRQVTDENGGAWQIGAPTATGSSQVYVSAVLGSEPSDYWRLGDISAPSTAVNVVKGSSLGYHNVTFDTGQLNTSPFSDTYGAIFNGTTSYATHGSVFVDVPLSGPNSIELWFREPAGTSTSGVLYSYQTFSPESLPPAVSWVPALYVGADGYLRGQIWTGGGNPITSTVKVNDGQWHHAVLSAASPSQTLYLDNVKVGTLAGTLTTTGAEHAYIGAGFTKNWPSSSGDVSYFKGNIAEVAYYHRELSAAQVDSHYKASKSAVQPTAGTTGSTLAPVSTVTVTDPTGKVSKQVFDLLRGNRLIAQTDTLANTTTYGYDVGGFESVIYDPIGVKASTGKDVRGNTIRSTVCTGPPPSLGSADSGCSTTYYTYWPDATTTNLTPDPRNDQLIQTRDARSASATDDTYLTTFAYDTAGNRASMTSPPVLGFPLGRTTTMTYSTLTTPAVGGGTTPAGLPLSTTSAGGASQTTDYNAAGDAVRVTDAGGLVTEFAFDALGRPKTRTIKAGAPVGDLVTTITYDADGQVYEQLEPAVTDQVTGAVHTAKTTTLYDQDGNVVDRKVTDTSGGDAFREVTSDYDNRGRVVKTVDPTGAVTLFEYDVYGNKTRTVACASSPVPGAACPSGDLLRAVANTFDGEGHQLTTVLTGRDGSTTQLSSKAYYPNGKLATDTDAMNWVTKYEYDNDDKPTRVTRTDGVKTYVVETNEYDDGFLTYHTTDNGVSTEGYAYDEAGRLTKVTRAGGDPDYNSRSTSYLYDADDHPVLTKSYQDNVSAATPLRVVGNTYDAMGRTTSQSVSLDANSHPAAWWRFNETGGAYAHDSSGYNLDALEYGSGLTWSDGAAVINKTAGLTYRQTQVVDTTKSYSVSAWVKVNNFSQAQTAVAAGWSTQSAFALQYNPSLNKWAFISAASNVTTPSAFYSASSNASLTANTWVHLVGVYDSTTSGMALYVNGALGGTGSNPTPFRTFEVDLGGQYLDASTNILDGSLSNVQMYQRALSASDVTTLYAGGTGRKANTYAASSQLTTSYTVDKRGQTTAMTDARGNTITYEYDAAGRQARVVSPPVSPETFGGPALPPTVAVSLAGYNTFGEQVETQDPLGNVSRVWVDAAGRPIRSIMPDYTPPGGAPILGAYSTTSYDGLGQVASTTDPLGNTTLYEYDALGNTNKITDPAGKISTAVYDAVGDLIESVDPTGAKTTATYDHAGRKLSSTEVVRQPTPQSNTTLYGYGNGVPGTIPWLQKVTSPDGVFVTKTYNRFGEPLTVSDGAGNSTAFAYDAMGRVVTTTMPDATKQTMTFDGAGRSTSTSQFDAAGVSLTTQTMGYDANGNMVTSRDPRGTTTTFSYDARNQAIGEVQPVTAISSITTSFGYDPAGNRTRFTDGRGNQFWTTYNTWGLPESQIEPATTAYPSVADRTFTMSYDAAGQATTQSSPGGVSITNTYDSLGRLIGQSGAGAEATTTDRTFGYDDAGRLTSLSVPSGADTVSYDDRGLPLAVTGPTNAATFSYTRDGRLASRNDAANTTTYNYDTAGRFAGALNATTGINLSVAYNTMSQVSSITYGSSNKRDFTYDPLHRLATDTLKTASGSTTLGSITYGYDLNSNETSKTTTGFTGSATNTYSYDLADRLTSWYNGATTTNYGYDNSGNRIQAGSKSFGYDARNQLLTQGAGTSYTYTPRGTLRQTIAASTTYTTDADAFGQIRSQASAGGTRTYDYDALGRAVQPGFRYTGLGNSLAQDSDATYTRGPGGDVLGEGAGTGTGSAYAWTDQHSDVVGQFTAAGAALSGSVAYDPLGAVLSAVSTVGHLGYQSGWTDSLTGRVNMAARWYNTDTGQFDTRDSVANNPVPDSVNANRFQYGDANPLTVTDPTGHWGWSNLVSAAKSVAAKVAAPVVATVKAATAVASSAMNYVASGRAWSDIKAGATAVASKASQAFNVVKDSAVRWAKKKVNAVKDAYQSAKKCVSGGVAKCVVETAKKQVKSAVDSIKNTVEEIKKDPWKFVATAAVGLAATVAVGALCATGVGCLILAGAVAGAMAAGSGYMVDVARGDQKFSWSGLAGTMIEGGLDGALSAGVSKFTGGVGNKLGVGRVTERLGIKPGGGLGRTEHSGGGGTPARLRPESSPDPVDVTVTWKPGMPKSEFRKKADSLQQLSDEGKLVKAETPHPPRDRAVTAGYKQDLIKRVYDQYGATNPGLADKLKDRILNKMDPDHVWELQLGGPDTRDNLRMLDRDTNQDIGMRQIWPQIQGLLTGTPIRIVIVGPPG